MQPTASPENIQALDDYAVFCDGKLDDPFPLYERLRTEDPVHCGAIGPIAGC